MQHSIGQKLELVRHRLCMYDKLHSTYLQAVFLTLYVQFSSELNSSYCFKIILNPPLYLLTGLRVNYDLERPPGDRIVSIMVLCQNCSVPKYEPLDKNQKYLIILNDFLLRGGDDYYIFKTSCTDVKNLSEYQTDLL